MIDQAALTLANPSRSGGTLLCAFPHPFRMGINPGQRQRKQGRKFRCRWLKSPASRSIYCYRCAAKGESDE